MSQDTNSRFAPEQLSRRTTHGLLWNFLVYGLSKGIVLITTSILARILTREDFGLVAVALIAINYLSIFKDLGLGAALIQRRGDVKEAANTVFTVNLIMGFILSSLVIPIAPLFASYFNDPHITSVLRLLGISFFINAIGSVHVAHLQRELDFRRKMVPDLGNAIIRCIVSIYMALYGYGVWSIVFGQLSGAITSVILVWIVYPWKPRISINPKIGRELVKFGAAIMGTDTISVTTENIDSIIAGRIFGLTQLSVYSLAYRLPEMLLLSNLWVMGGVVFPAFSSIQDQPSELRKGFLASIRLVELIALPICLYLVIAAHPIVLAIFGEQWLETVPILRVLGLYAWVYSIGYHVGGIYKAIGRPDILFKLSLISLAIIFPALLIGSRFGLIGIAFGQLIAMMIRRSISLTVATKLVKVSILDILTELKPAALGGIGLSIITIILLWLTPDLNAFIRLPISALLGATCYLWIVWKSEGSKLRHLFQTAVR